VSSAPDLTSRILRHERAIVAIGIALLVALSWWFLIAGAGLDKMSGMSAGVMPPPFAALALMWWLMMYVGSISRLRIRSSSGRR
jgi:lipopolysaccharide export LptBFGC system permease protein LptF